METSNEIILNKLFLLIHKFFIKMGRPITVLIKMQIVPSHFWLMTHLLSDGEMTMGEISKNMIISKQQATQIVDKMISLGYVRRESDDSDRRIVKIVATEEGKAMTHMCNKRLINEFLENLNNSTEENMAILLESISNIEKVLNTL